MSNIVQKFALGQTVYYYDRNYSKYFKCKIVAAYDSSSGYTADYAVIKEGQTTKRYAKAYELNSEMPISTRKELYKLIGPEATKIIRKLRNQGFITIDLPANEYDKRVTE